MLNRLTIQGRLTATPVLRFTESGVPYLKFAIAHQDDFPNKEGGYSTHFIPAIAWRGNAEHIAGHFHQGQPIVIDGKLSIREYTDPNNQQKRTTYEILVDATYFSGGLPREEMSASDFLSTDCNSKP